ncbi:MAG TPA: glycosyltransferase family 4 protein [Candidatus Angelobacter sp.]|nr:glycosyltransferase family 4 protein [Candidatus Angelobacter sp.]
MAYIALGSALLSWVLVGFIIKKAPVIGLMDRPNDRSLHTQTTPRGGGLGFILTWLFGCIVWWCSRGRGGLPWGSLTVFVAAVMIIAIISLWDDFRSIGVGIRLAVHLVCATVAIAGFSYFRTVNVGFIVPLGWAGMLVTAIWMVGLTNVFNFMDGVDGIAGIQGLVAGLAWSIAGGYFHLPTVAVLGALLAGGCAGFLIRNWSPARIFMGDVGSAFLGFCFSALPLIMLIEINGRADAYMVASVPGFALMVVWPFVADGMLTFFRRLLNREPVWKSHRGHLYQRLVQAGLSHSTVASYYGLWAAMCSVAGFFYLTEGFGRWTWCIALLFLCVTWATTLHLERRKKTANP